ncbi:MAG: dihydroorotase [Burkholderiaceae bacterium]|nr:dihydroorotase [Burkholderiaceae bacterium]
MSVDTLTIARPDDWHLHLRDGAAMGSVLQHTARQFARAIVMPNLAPPITTTEQAAAYRQRIHQALPRELVFEPLMTIYLTDHTAPDEIRRAHESAFVHAVKLYPAGATTHSASGVTNVRRCARVFEVMQRIGMPLLVHGEVTSAQVDVFDRERVFIEQVLIPLRRDFPLLKIVFEHITTAEAVSYVREEKGPIGATITAHHLLFNRNSIFMTTDGQPGMRPHYYCLPVLKREAHRRALVSAATSESARFFLGTDSAPHAKGDKEAACGCAGCFTAASALELYMEAFDQANALDRFEAFASFNGPDFYDLPRNSQTVTLARSAWTLPAEFPLGDASVVPLRAGGTLQWTLQA